MSAAGPRDAPRLYSHWAQGDWRYGADLFADDVRDDSTRTARRSCSRARRRCGPGSAASWSSGTISARRSTSCSISATASCRAVQTATGRASGARPRCRSTTVRFRDGKVVEFHTTRHEDVADRQGWTRTRDNNDYVNLTRELQAPPRARGGRGGVLNEERFRLAPMRVATKPDSLQERLALAAGLGPRLCSRRSRRWPWRGPSWPARRSGSSTRSTTGLTTRTASRGG